MTPSPYDFDVVVIGGGPAGCATTLSLLKHSGSPTSLRVLLIDDTDSAAYKIGESLPAAAKRTLPTLDPSLLPRLLRDTSNGLHDVCTGNASAWASSALHETHAIMNPYGAGWHLDRVHFDETLRLACGAVLQKARFKSVKRFADETTEGPPDASNDKAITFGWEVEAEMMVRGVVEKFRTRWIVDATGRKTSVAHKIGAKTRKHHDLLTFYFLLDLLEDPDSPQQSLKDQDSRTLIEASSSGWWYTACLPHGKRLVTYTTSPSDPTARLARNAHTFIDLMYSQTVHIARTLHRPSPYSDQPIAGPDLGTDAHRLQLPEPLYELPPSSARAQCTAAGSSVLEPYASWEAGQEGASGAGRGWCAVGDAALAFDPLSSQGIITALDAGAFLGARLAQTLSVPPEAMSAGVLGSPDCQSPLSPFPDFVRELTAAYERVREKYEHGRRHYYDIVQRFDAGEVDSDSIIDGDLGSAAKRGRTSFWKVQQASL